jgi:comEA protein
MNKAMWNSLVAGAIAAGLIASHPTLAAKKKTPTPVAEDSKSTKADKVERVDLNSADEKTIAGAKGVGDKLAKELVKSRPYRTWEEVSKVKGVGDGKKLASLRKVLKLGSGSGAAADEGTSKSKGSKKSSSKSDAASSDASTDKSSRTSSSSSSSDKDSSSKGEASSVPKLAPGETININRASAAELEKLPEIGPVKAQAIVDYRNANGRFASIEDIMKVSGIKEGIFGTIKNHITVR